MPRKALPQNHCLSIGDLIEDFKNPSDWSIAVGSTGGAIEADTVNFRTGSQSLKVSATVDGETGKTVLVEKNVNLDFSNSYKNATFDIYVRDTTEIINIWLRLVTSVGSDTKYIHRQLNARVLVNGWNKIATSYSDWQYAGGANFNEPVVKLQIRIYSALGKRASVSWDNLRFGVINKPKLLFTFDDACKSAYDNAYQYMRALGLRGTFFPCSKLLTGGVRMTSAELDSAYANGWAVGNHSNDTVPLTTLTEAEIIANVQSEINFLLGRGYNRSAYHFALPDNANNALVSSVLEDLGILSVRTLLSNYFGVPTTICGLGSAISLATATGYINNAIRDGSTIIFYAHYIDTIAAVSTWAISDMHALIDYAIQRKIDVVTIDEWHEGLTNPRYRSVQLDRTTV